MANVTDKKVLMATTLEPKDTLTILSTQIVKHLSNPEYDTLENRIALLNSSVEYFLQKYGITGIKTQLNLDPMEDQALAGYNNQTKTLEFFVSALEDRSIFHIIEAAAHECYHVYQYHTKYRPKRINSTESEVAHQKSFDYLETKQLLEYFNANYHTRFNPDILAIFLYNSTQLEFEAFDNQTKETLAVIEFTKKVCKKMQKKLPNFETVFEAIIKAEKSETEALNDAKETRDMSLKAVKNNLKALVSSATRFQVEFIDKISNPKFVESMAKARNYEQFRSDFRLLLASLEISHSKELVDDLISTFAEQQLGKYSAEVANTPCVPFDEQQAEICIASIYSKYLACSSLIPTFSLKTMLAKSSTEAFIKENLSNVNTEDLMVILEKVISKELQATSDHVAAPVIFTDEHID